MFREGKNQKKKKKTYLLNLNLNLFFFYEFQKSLDLGNKLLYRSKNLLLEYEDAASLQEGEKITLMKWGNVKIVSLKQLGDKIELIGEYLPEDKDFKSTKKLSWVAQDAPTVHTYIFFTLSLSLYSQGSRVNESK